jgi:hypothetical protein
MVKPIDKDPIHLSTEDTAVHTGHEVLVETDNNSDLFKEIITAKKYLQKL